MSVVSVRISKELKDRMSKLQEDWANYLRQMIEQRITQHERMQASKVIDSIRAKTKEGRYSAAKTIREDRDRK
jgi:predicted DNA-binding protein